METETIEESFKGAAIALAAFPLRSRTHGGEAARGGFQATSKVGIVLIFSPSSCSACHRS
jgi:hypothetical protein